MRADLNHLPASERNELRVIADLILDRFEEAHSRRAMPWRKKGRVHKIILQGNDARRGPSDEPPIEADTSACNLLVVVNHRRVVEHASFWNGLRRTLSALLRARRSARTVGINVQTRQELDSAILNGRQLGTDIASAGIALYQDDDKPLPSPRSQTMAAELALAQECFEAWFVVARDFYDAFEFNLERSRTRTAAFQLHQAVEHSYRTALLVGKQETARVHDLRRLHDLATRIDCRFGDVWPDDEPWQTAAFNMLRDAYVAGRYSTYRITVDQLGWLGNRAADLTRIVDIVCRRHLAALERRLAGRAEPHDGTGDALVSELGRATS